MTCGPPVKAWVNAFLNGAELIIDVGVNAPVTISSEKIVVSDKDFNILANWKVPY